MYITGLCAPRTPPSGKILTYAEVLVYAYSPAATGLTLLCGLKFFSLHYACPGNQFEKSFNWLSVSIEQFEIISIKENGRQNTKFLSEKKSTNSQLFFLSTNYSIFPLRNLLEI